MRTTLTLDDDVAMALQRLRRRGDGTLKEIVNNALRAGLAQLERGTGRRKKFRTKEVHLGPPKLANLDDIAEALAVADGEDFR